MPGKPSSAPLTPGTCHSLKPAPGSGKYNHAYWAMSLFVEISSTEILYLHLGENSTNVREYGICEALDVYAV